MPTRRCAVVFAPPPCQRLPTHTSTLPRGISAGMVAWSSGKPGASSHRCEPGTSRVAPFASLKSVIAHIVLQMIGTCGRGSGISWSSAWSICALSSGPMAIEDSEETRSPSSKTPSTTGRTAGCTGIDSNVAPCTSRL